jgi:polyphosphate kinase 2 (PPK2 family)
VLRETSTSTAPWMVVEGADANFRAVAVGKVLLELLSARVAGAKASLATGKKTADKTAKAKLPPPMPRVDNRNLLSSMNLRQRMDKNRYEKQIEKLQGDLNLLSRDKKFAGRSTVLLFEGMDAAGKGSAIRRITAALDARKYHIVPVAAPTEEERAQPYLWRFWRHLPPTGIVTIFDRSWYGRVLVERVEGFCSPADWMRGYTEINDFEEQMTHGNAMLIKFWLQISKEEQLRRFKMREVTEFKRFKITEEDWRNRKKWGDYEAAVCDMVDRTSTEIAPWTLVEAEDKLFARIKILKTIIARLESSR